MSEKEESKDRTLNVLFPGEEVDIGGGVKVTVRPLSLPHLPKVINAFSSLMSKAEAGMPPSELAVNGMLDLVELLPFCLDLQSEEIPVTALPDILEKVIEQNVSDAVVGKWQALIPKLTGVLGLSIRKVPVADQGTEKEKKA